MSTQTNVTPDTLNDFVEQGDVLINFTSETIASSVPGISLGTDGTATLLQDVAFPVSAASIPGVAALLTSEIRRLVVVTDGDDRVADFVAELESTGAAYMVCKLEEPCDADAFMDVADSEAVAERLRQLGYI